MGGEQQLLASVGPAGGQEVLHQARGQHGVQASVQLVHNIHLGPYGVIGPLQVEQHGQQPHQALGAGGLHPQRELRFSPSAPW